MTVGEKAINQGQIEMAEEIGVKVNNGAEAYLELLRSYGVKYFFINPGTDTAPINDAFAKLAAEGKKELKLIFVPHENTATTMAYGYAMMTGEPQVVMVHVTVGTANALGAIMNAYRGRVPIILTAGRTPITEEGLPGSRDSRVHWGQESYDQGGLIREFVKWDYELRTIKQLPTIVCRAFKIALTEPQGPVYLILPREWLMEKVNGLKIPQMDRYRPPSPPGPDVAKLEEAAEILVNADKPLIITGSLGRKPEAISKLVNLAELLAIPVIESPRLRMNFPTDHPLHLGFDPHPYLKEVDVILLIDTELPWIPERNKPRDETSVIQIDVEPCYMSIPVWGFPVDLPITSEPNLALPSLTSAVKGSLKKSSKNEAISERYNKVSAEHNRQRASWKEVALKTRNDKPIDLLWLSRMIDEVKEEETILINEYSLALTQIRQNIPGTYFSISSAAHLGWGFGSALGAKLARPDKTVIACLGDGSYIFNNPTACHWASMAYKLPVLIVVFNNRCYGAVRRSISSLLPDGWSKKSRKFEGTDFEPPPSFVELVRANGGYGEIVDEPSEIKAALERGLGIVRKEGKQALIDVICKKP